jgi:hypothetical protein
MTTSEKKLPLRKKFGKKPKKKKKSLREKTKFRALTKGVNLKSRGELIDYDYINKLSYEEKKWLNDFTEGWTNADFRSEDTKKVFENHEHIRKEAFRRNNYRNFDLYSKKKMNNGLISLEEYYGNPDDEDTVTIEELIDLKREQESNDEMPE